MTAYAFKPDQIELADAHWRAIDRVLARWVIAHGGSALLAQCAARCSFAEGLGHTAVLLDAETANVISAEPLVGGGEATSAFVLDDACRFYFWRNFAAERGVATAIAALADDSVTQTSAAEDLVDQLFAKQHPERTAKQRAAVRAVPAHRLFVLTGGPGTGKTTTVVSMLLTLLHQAGSERSVRVAAPTGKAAQRLVQALNRGLRLLAPVLDRRWDVAIARMPKSEALTLHRLLGFDPRRNRFNRDADNPLSADIVVIDEASMMDLEQARALLAALKPGSTLILVGDPDQLTSVAAGAVLLDIVQALEAMQAPQLMRLEHVFRASTHLLPVNQAVRAGDAAALAAAMNRTPDKLSWRALHDQRTLQAALAAWAAELAAVLRQAGISARHTPATARLVLSRLSSMQLLCALRETDFGATAVHRFIEARIRSALEVAVDETWYAGRMLMITRNDYANNLFNGDVGIALRDVDDELLVWFETVGDDGEISARGFAPDSVSDHEGAFAITIHKSQGSEYQSVVLVFPPDAENRVISRELLYTGVSRAQDSLAIWGSADVINAALARPVQRSSGLTDALLSRRRR